MELKVHAELKARGFKAGYLAFAGLMIPTASAALDSEIARLCEDARTAFADKKPSDSPVIENVRRLFSRCGIDPTKHRPSPESLLRRVLRDGATGFPRINIPVDIGNCIQLKYLSPLGLYDSDKVSEPIEIRLGAPGESYTAIGNRPMNTEDRIVSADPQGVFGSPIADAERARITPMTTDLLVIFYVPAGFDLEAPMKTMADLMTSVCACQLTQQAVLS